MPNTRSAKKRLRQNVKQRANNRSYKSQAKTEVKKFLAAVDAKDAEGAKKAFADVVSTLDKVSGKGVIHKNSAARTKSRLSKKLAALSGSAPAQTTESTPQAAEPK